MVNVRSGGIRSTSRIEHFTSFIILDKVFQQIIYIYYMIMSRTVFCSWTIHNNNRYKNNKLEEWIKENVRFNFGCNIRWTCGGHQSITKRYRDGIKNKRRKGKTVTCRSYLWVSFCFVFEITNIHTDSYIFTVFNTLLFGILESSKYSP